jgi:hypothetical protein
MTTIAITIRQPTPDLSRLAVWVGLLGAPDWG